MKPEETEVWLVYYVVTLGASLAIATLVAVLAGQVSALTFLGLWFWPVVLTVALLFRNTYLAGERKGSRED